MGRNPKKKSSKKKSGGGGGSKHDSDDEWEEGITTITGEESGDEMMDEDGGDPDRMDDGTVQRAQVWRPGVDGMDEDEELEYDPSVYDCLHAWQLDWPCLSFDVVRDELGDDRTHFPHSMFMVAGTQAAQPTQNSLTVMRLTRLKKTRRKNRGADEDESESESDSDDEDGGGPGGDGPLLQVQKVAHHGGINRVRCMPQCPAITASWGETGIVQVWDLQPQLQQLMSLTADAGAAGTGAAGAAHAPQRVAPRHAFTGHGDEGYALDWSPVVEGRLATGDNLGAIHVWEPAEGGKWAVDKNAPCVNGHDSSVEDIQWSPAERDVFASCGADGRVCVWDARQRARPALKAKVHDVDCNVTSWNRRANYMLATGADDGTMRIWDLRNFGAGAGAGGGGAGAVLEPNFVANFAFHRAPVTSVEWARFDSAMLATASADHTVCVWDLAVERDAEEEAAAMAAEGNAVAPEDLPPQLMFVHQGLRDPKELHWHHQIPGMCLTTAADGFNAFKAYNVGNEVQ